MKFLFRSGFLCAFLCLIGARAADFPALFKERVKCVVAVEFFIESELDRRPSVTTALVADTNGTLVLPPSAING